MIIIDMEKINKLREESVNINRLIEEKEKELKKITKELDDKNNEIKKLIAKGYWWTCDIDDTWKKPKKYSIKEVSCHKSGEIYLTVKEVFKKRPWPGFTGEHIYTLDRFIKINISKTEQEAAEKYYNRICPKCGGIMKYSRYTWCMECMNERDKIKKEFRENHTFYCPETDAVYYMEYTDELTREKGYYGKHFTIRRLDNGEIIHTDNLWSISRGNSWNHPEIEFLEEHDNE